MPMIASLCNRCLLISGGVLSEDGVPSSVILRYQVAGGAGGSAFVDYRSAAKKPGDNFACLLMAWIEDDSGGRVSEVAIERPFSLHLIYEVLQEYPEEPCPNLHFFDSRGNCAFVSAATVERSRAAEPGVRHAVCEVPGNYLNDGLFSVGLALTFTRGGSYHVSFYDQDAIHFAVVDRMEGVPTRAAGYLGPMPGVFRPLLPWSLRCIDPGSLSGAAS